MAEHPWFVVQTEPQREFQALHRIAAVDGLKPWLVLLVTTRFARKQGRPVYTNGKRLREDSLRPFFPGYILVSFDPSSPQWAPLLRRNRELRTVRLFCDMQHRPMAIPTEDVDALRSRGRAGDGAIDLEACAPAGPRYAVGDAVRVIEGPFAETSGIVQWSDARRVEVLLGRLKVRLASEQLAPMQPTVPSDKICLRT